MIKYLFENSLTKFEQISEKKGDAVKTKVTWVGSKWETHSW